MEEEGEELDTPQGFDTDCTWIKGNHHPLSSKSEKAVHVNNVGNALSPQHCVWMVSKAVADGVCQPRTTFASMPGAGHGPCWCAEQGCSAELEDGAVWYDSGSPNTAQSGPMTSVISTLGTGAVELQCDDMTRVQTTCNSSGAFEPSVACEKADTGDVARLDDNVTMLPPDVALAVRVPCVP